MNRNEQIGPLAIRNRGARFKRNKGIVLAGVDDFSTQARLKQAAETLGDIEHKVLLEQSIGTDRPGVMSAVTGVNHDPSYLQAESAGERAVPGSHGPGFADFEVGG